MEAILYDLNNHEKSKINVSDQIFNYKVNDYLIWLSIKVEEANKRIGSANSKTKAEVKGSGKKPWRQKGTGRARVGTRRNPVWVGGGVVFGPRPHSYKLNINKKMKDRAYFSLLSLKLKKNSLRFIEDISLENAKTKAMSEIMTKLDLASTTVLIYGDRTEKENYLGEKVLTVSEQDKKIKLASQNVKYLKTLHWNNLNAKDIFYAKNLLITESALKNLQDKYLSKIEAV